MLIVPPPNLSTSADRELLIRSFVVAIGAVVVVAEFGCRFMFNLYLPPSAQYQWWVGAGVCIALAGDAAMLIALGVIIGLKWGDPRSADQ